MNRKDYGWLAGLLALAVLIWLRDRSWLSAPEETVPLFAALPLFFLLGGGRAILVRTATVPVPTGPMLTGAVLLVAGLALNITILLALAWTVFFRTWLVSRTAPEKLVPLRRLLVLALLAFPWLSEDLPQLGWWFRLSAAWTAGHLFQLAGFGVTREGTDLVVQGLPVSVTAACAGLKALQAMLVAGTVLAFAQLGDRRGYWVAVLSLPVVAWSANTLRVIVLSTVALTYGTPAAQGWFHEWGGLFALVAMFALCWGIFAAVRRWLPK